MNLNTWTFDHEKCMRELEEFQKDCEISHESFVQSYPKILAEIWCLSIVREKYAPWREYLKQIVMNEVRICEWGEGLVEFDEPTPSVHFVTSGSRILMWTEGKI